MPRWGTVGVGRDDDDDDDDDGAGRASTLSRRRQSILAAPLLSSLAASFPVTDGRRGAALAAADAGETLYSPKFVETYDDFTATPEGWSYKDVKVGNKGDAGVTLRDGDRVMFDWSGYTIGYFVGRSRPRGEYL